MHHSLQKTCCNPLKTHCNPPKTCCTPPEACNSLPKTCYKPCHNTKKDEPTKESENVNVRKLFIVAKLQLQSLQSCFANF